MGKGGKGISAVRLAGEVGVSEWEIRKAVSELRDEGCPICADPKHGYFYPVSKEEIEETCEYLHKRSLHGLRLDSQMRQIPLPALMGQLQLEFTEEDGPEDGPTPRRECAEAGRVSQYR